MPINIACKCGAKFAARDALAGSVVECVTCGQRLRVPSPNNMAGGGSNGMSAVSVTGVLLGLAALGGAGFLFMKFTALNKDVGALRTELAATKTGVEKRVAEGLAAATAARDQLELTAAQEKTDSETQREALRGDLETQKAAHRQLSGDLTRAQVTRQIWEQKIELENKAHADKMRGLKAGEVKAKRLLDDHKKKLKDLKDNLKKSRDAEAALRKAQALATTKLLKLRSEFTTQASTNANVNDLASVNQSLNDRIDALGASLVQRFPMIAASSTAGFWNGAAVQLDSSTGDVIVAPDNGVPAFWVQESSARSPETGTVGRFTIQLTTNSVGADRLIRLDTQTGSVWQCFISGAAASWLNIANPNRGAGPARNNLWLIEVTPGGSSTAPLLLTNTDVGAMFSDWGTQLVFVPIP